MSEGKRRGIVDGDRFVPFIMGGLFTKEINKRKEDHPILTPKKFATTYSKPLMFREVGVYFEGTFLGVQMNFCTDPYCVNFGQPQSDKRLPTKFRYKTQGTSKKDDYLVCNEIEELETILPITSRTSTVMSNQSVANEISRLYFSHRTMEYEPDYQFHKENCSHQETTPRENPNYFYKAGKTHKGAQRWQCKTCNKKTSYIPTQRQSITYTQKRNKVLHDFAKLVISHTPVKRICEFLDIGSQTYYAKLNILYEKCIMFLERHELNNLKQLEVDEMWLNTDVMTYHLNNLRKKGKGGTHITRQNKDALPVDVVITGDNQSRYILGSDVAFHSYITPEELNENTINYHEDHLRDYAKQFAHLEWDHYPQQPTENDKQNESEYYKELKELEERFEYVEGLRINYSYTALARLFLIKNTIKANEWRFVSDDDNGLKTAFMRTFQPEIKKGDGHLFICRTDKSISRDDAKREYFSDLKKLRQWGLENGFEPKTTKSTLAYYYLQEELQHHEFHKNITKNGKVFRDYANNPLPHPLGHPDRGSYTVDIRTDVSGYGDDELAELIMNVNDDAVNSFMQQIRRRLSLLERPLVTARGDGKTYIYSNYNPKYAQMLLTILRTYYNFCMPYKTKRNGVKQSVMELK